MKKYLFVRVVTTLLTFQVFGCTAEGLFPNCGNGQLELALGEECDGNQFPTSSFSCELHGFNEGYLLCSSSCEFDFSQCEGVGTCDPVANSGCSGGNACYFFPRSVRTNCVSVGAVELGLSCSLSSSCAPKLICIDYKCRNICAADEQCSNGEACIAAPGHPYGYCPY